MPAKGSVRLTRQTIYCFIPIMDLYAAYNVKKLRWYLLIMLGTGAVLTGGAELIYPQESRYDESMFLENKEMNWAHVMLGENPELTIISIIIHNAIAYAIAVYLIRKWSKKWNLQFT